MDDLEFVYSPDHQLATLHPPAESKDSKPPNRPGSSSGSRSTSPGEAVDDTLDSVCVFSEFDERRAVLVVKKDTSVDQIVDFVLAHSLPKVLMPVCARVQFLLQPYVLLSSSSLLLIVLL